MSNGDDTSPATTATRPEIHDVTDAATWKLVMSPVRCEICEALRTLGPCAIRDVAEFLDRPADTLYRHVAQLEEVGIVVDAGTRRRGRHVERLLDLVADDVRPAFDPTSGPDEMATLVHAIETSMDVTRRAVRETGDLQAFRIDEESRNVVLSWEFGWLRQEDVNEARELVLRLKALMDEGKRRREGRPFMWLGVLTEVAHKRGARRPARGSPDAD